MSEISVAKRFIPEQFELSVFAGRTFELDQEVAARIANVVWAYDKAGHGGNNHSRDTSFIVDPTGGEGNSHAPHSEGDIYVPSYRASFDVRQGQTPIEDSNPAFGRALQQAFDDGNRRNRLGLGGTTLFMAIPAGATAGGEALAIGGHDPVAAVVVGAIGGLGTAAGLAMGGYNAYRRAVTNPNFGYLNERHLQAAARHAVSLELPPLLVSAGKTK
jgi:hypothetical protein